MRPPDVASGHQARQPDSRPHADSAAATAPEVDAIVRHGADDRQAKTRRGRLPIASASLYEPAAGRTWWWLSVRCPRCGAVHLGRVRTEAEAGGPRRAGCGRRVWVIVRRVYRSYATRGAA